MRCVVMRVSPCSSIQPGSRQLKSRTNSLQHSCLDIAECLASSQVTDVNFAGPNSAGFEKVGSKLNDVLQ